MKAISIKNPWASLILYGIKDVENRTWPTNYRGRILIHTSQAPDRRAAFTDSQAKAITNAYTAAAAAGKPLALTLRDGWILGEVEILDCIRTSRSMWAEPGVWHWVLSRPVVYNHPVPCRGALSIWSPSIEALEGLRQFNPGLVWR